jgi:hypothetical protein
MFLLLTFTLSTDILAHTIPGNSNSRDKAIQDLPCTEYVDVYYDRFPVALRSGKKVCVRSAGSIFIDGTDITITGYTNEIKKVSGKGVAANLGNGYGSDPYVFMLESSKTQTVSVINCVTLPTGFPIYVTTKNKHDEVNILKKINEDDFYYYGGYLLLGPKTNIHLTVSTGFVSYANVTSIGEYSTSYVEDKDEQSFSGDALGYLVLGNSTFSSQKIYVELKSEGTSWKTEIDGFITGQYNRVYSKDEFESNSSLDPFALILIIIISAIFVIVLAIVICCCCCICCIAKSQNNQNELNNIDTSTIVITPNQGSSQNNSQGQQYSNSPPTYAAQPPTYEAQPPTYAAQQPTYAAQPPTYAAQQPTYAAQQPTYPAQGAPQYQDAKEEPTYMPQPVYSQPQASQGQPYYENPYGY